MAIYTLFLKPSIAVTVKIAQVSFAPAVAGDIFSAIRQSPDWGVLLRLHSGAA